MHKPSLERLSVCVLLTRAAYVCYLRKLFFFSCAYAQKDTQELLQRLGMTRYADVFIDIYGKLPSIAFLRSLSISELAADMCTDRDAVELYQAVQDDAVELYQALHPGPLCYV
jgi:hypothetical protein